MVFKDKFDSSILVVQKATKQLEQMAQELILSTVKIQANLRARTTKTWKKLEENGLKANQDAMIRL